ncbi:MAG: MFS transporter [Chloroflexi bacterium]|nr:MFS transporter [Chloroflexota bacterium]
MNEPLPRDGDAAPPDPAEAAQHDSRSTPLPAPGFASVLRNRSFLAIWTAQVTSQTSQNTLWYALIILVGNLTGQSTLGVGLTIILVQLPTVLFSSVSGVFVDRVSKRMILIGTNVIRVVGVLGYVLFQTHVEGLYLVTFIVAVVSQPFAPAEGATLPLLVRPEELITANSLFQMTFMASQAAGFALGPIAIGLLGMRITLFVLSGLFGVAALSLLGLPPITDQRKPGEAVPLRQAAINVWHDLIEAGEFILHDPPLAVALLQISLAPTLLLVLAEVGPNFLRYSLGISQTGTGLFFLLAPAGVGLATGMVILGQWGHRLRKDRLVLVSLIALGLTVIGLASVPILGTFWNGIRRLGLDIPQGVQLTLTMVPISALLGILVAFINAPVQTIVQQRAKPELRGRVLAMQQTLTAAMAIPPLILVGGIAAIFGTPATLTMMGLAIIVVGLVLVYYA